VRASIGLFLLLCLLSWSTYGQDMKVDITADGKADTSYMTKWDSASDCVVLYRDVSVAGVIAARVQCKDGVAKSYYPLRDFPEARNMTIWAAAATPDRGIMIAAVLLYGEPDKKNPPVKSMLLTYDAQGVLRKVWDVDPYHFHQVAVDTQGDVFALGDRRDSTPDMNYPLLIKYSSKGSVQRELLEVKHFGGDAAVASDSPYGESAVFIQNQQLYVWLAPRREILTFSLDGELRSRVSLASSLNELATSTHSRLAQVLCLSANRAGLIAQVRLWPEAQEEKSRTGMVQLAGDGTSAKIITPLTEVFAPGRFLGTNSSGRNVFLDAYTGTVKEY